MDSNQNEFFIGQIITIICNKEQIIVDKFKKNVVIWLNTKVQLEIPIVELKYGVKETYPQSVQEILNIFQNPVKAIVQTKTLKMHTFEDGQHEIRQYQVSIKEYLKKQLEKVKIGDTYFCPISSIAPWGLFVKIDGELIALCHCTEVSKSIIYELDKCFKIGEMIKVTVIGKKHIQTIIVLLYLEEKLQFQLNMNLEI